MQAAVSFSVERFHTFRLARKCENSKIRGHFWPPRILAVWILTLEIYSVIRAAQKRFVFVMAELRDIEDYLEDY